MQDDGGDPLLGLRVGARVSWTEDGRAVLGQVTRVSAGAAPASSRVQAISDAAIARGGRPRLAQPSSYAKSDATLPTGVRKVMPLRAGWRVSLVREGSSVLATVRSANKHGDAVAVDDGGLEVRGTTADFAPVDAPPLEVPPPLARVEWDEAGTVRLGVVVRSSPTRVEAMLDGASGLRAGPPRMFRPSVAPLPSDPPSMMDEWDVAGMRHGRDGFRARVTFRGKVVARARGDAGSVDLAGAGAGEFRERAAAWAESHGHEPADPALAYILFRARAAPFGVLAGEFLEQMGGRPPAP